MVKTGYMPFKGHQTYYKIYQCTNNKRIPLLVIHGGPGSTHNSFESIKSLAKKRTLIMYDQIGCGLSFVSGPHPDLFNLKIWIEELDSLINFLGLQKINLLGHSWGGMLLIAYLADKKPVGINSVILSSSLSNSALWASEQHAFISTMSKEDQNIISRSEQNNNYQSLDFQKATADFLALRVCDPPESSSFACVRRPKISGKEAYQEAWGPSEFLATGSLKDFDYTSKLHNIVQPALVMHGKYDECTDTIAKCIYTNLGNPKGLVLFEKSRHMTYVEENKKYMNVIEEFMEEYD